MPADYRDDARDDLINGSIVQLFAMLLTKGLITADEWPAAIDAALRPLLRPGDPDSVTVIGRAVPDSDQAGYAAAATAARDRIVAAVLAALARDAPPDPGP